MASSRSSRRVSIEQPDGFGERSSVSSVQKPAAQGRRVSMDAAAPRRISMEKTEKELKAEKRRMKFSSAPPSTVKYASEGAESDSKNDDNVSKSSASLSSGSDTEPEWLQQQKIARQAQPRKSMLKSKLLSVTRTSNQMGKRISMAAPLGATLNFKAGSARPSLKTGVRLSTVADRRKTIDGDFSAANNQAALGDSKSSLRGSVKVGVEEKRSFVRFGDSDGEAKSSTRRGSINVRGNYLDELAVKRANKKDEWKLRVATKEQAILHHRDSIAGKVLSETQLRQLTMQAANQVNRVPQAKPSDKKTSSRSPRGSKEYKLWNSEEEVVKPTRSIGSLQLLRSIKIFANCSDEFLGMIASSAEHLQMKTGEVRDMDGSRVGVARVRPAVAIIVESGTFRIEIGHQVVDECQPGSCFGLANVLVNASAVGVGRSGNAGAQAPIDFVVRASGTCPDGYRIMVFNSIGLRNAIQECPMDHAQLQEIFHAVNLSINTTHQFVTLLHCCESAKAAITESTTRHIYPKGEYICREHQRNPDGLVLIRSGTVTLEINGVEVRRISKGQAIGEEILFGVSRKWGVSAQCTTLCDVVILHRRLFASAARGMHDGSTEERRESERLMLFMEGHWRDDKLILSWPLFRGFDGDLLSSLAHLIETRVLLPGIKLWEGGGNTNHQVVETALYVLLSGACEETMTTEQQKRPGHAGATETRSVRRPLVPGTCIGTDEFLGLRSVAHLVVKARSLCIVAVLHRAVFLKAMDIHPIETPQAAEITRVLKNELDKDQKDKLEKVGHCRSTARSYDVAFAFVGTMPFLNTHDKRFVDRLCSHACKRRYCIAGQSICHTSRPANTMYVFLRGLASLTIADIHIKDYSCGEAFNTLALAEEVFIPTYTVKCIRTCDFWSISQDDFAACLDALPFERAKFKELLHAPTDLEVVVKTQNARRISSEQIDPKNWGGDGRVESPDASPGPGCALAINDIQMFRNCSSEFLGWIAEHLQAAIYFCDEIVVPQGGEDSSLYIIRHGSIISEGIDTHDTHQERLEAGATIGQKRLLGIAQKSQTNNQALEVSVVQILYRSVFRKGLELFPDQAPFFDKMILGQMDGVATFELTHSKFFDPCSKDLCRQLERIIKTRLVHPGSVLVEEGSERNVLYIIKSGVAIVHDKDEQGEDHQEGGALHGIKNLRDFRKKKEPTRLTNGATVNADVVLGTARYAPATVKTECMCAVGEVDGPELLRILKRFPHDIIPLIHTAAGSLWPTESESVPLFRGVNHHFFAQLLEKSDWIMFLPDQCVVKQGGRGDNLFLLCHGTAVEEVDGIVIENTLNRGDCVGKPNFFGLTTRYFSTVRTCSVCHWRSIPGSQLADLLIEHIAERERFVSLKVKVQVEAAEQEVNVKNQATREKLHRREEKAFRQHISREREFRGLSDAFNSSLGSLFESELPKFTENQVAEQPDSNWNEYKIQRTSVHQSRGSVHNNRSSIHHHNHHHSVSSQQHHHSVTSQKSRDTRRSTKGMREDLRQILSNSTGNFGNTLVARMRALLSPIPNAATAANTPSMSRVGSPTGNKDGANKCGSERHEDNSDDSAKSSIFGDDDDNMLSKRVADFKASRRNSECSDDASSKSSSESATQMSRKKQISAAISQHSGARKRAILKGKLLRMMHSGLAPRGRGGLSQEDLHILSQNLPDAAHTSTESLAKPDTASSASSVRLQNKRAQMLAGRPPMQTEEAYGAAEKALRRKYKQLSCKQWGGLVPIV